MLMRVLLAHTPGGWTYPRLTFAGRRAGGPAVSSWLGSCSGLCGLGKDRRAIAPRFPLLRPRWAFGAGYAVLTGRFDNALHPLIMRDLWNSGREFLLFA